MDVKLVGIAVVLLLALIVFFGASIQNNDGVVTLGKPSGCNYDGSCQGWESSTCPDCAGVSNGDKTKPECNDKIDNDGDGWIDLDDSGCLKRADNDETDCGDGVCEGPESCTYCPEDCGECPTTTTIPPTTTTTSPVTTTIITTTVPPNSCSDTDGGLVYTIKGTVSGLSNGVPYSYTDYCQATNSTWILEYYCVGSDWDAQWHDCAGNVTTTCSDGACV